VRRTTGEQAWETAQKAARWDLAVYLALSAFTGRPKFKALPEDVQLDVKALYGNYKLACAAADQLLFAAGEQAAINNACSDSSLGKITPEALYVHVSAVGSLNPLLRVYEGCGRSLTGVIGEATLVKLNRLQPKVSYLVYPDFDRDPHPALHASLLVDLRRLHVKYRDFTGSSNPPVLHRKECFVPDHYSGRHKFARLTAQEERAGLLDESAGIGSRVGWQDRLNRMGFRLSGHRLIKASHVTT
jgi:DNA phosphorothioation-associated putative methyltransferase